MKSVFENIESVLHEADWLNCRTEKEVCITMSSNNCRKIIEEYTNLLNVSNTGISNIKIFGYRVYPSDFISDNDFLIGTKI